MNELEDEPLDVQQATPVGDEVRRGQVYEIARKRVEGSAKHSCKRERPSEPNPDCCELKRRKPSGPKSVKMFVFGPECDIYDQKERVYPQCFTKKEYLDFLATPKQFCPTQCAKVEVTRRVLPISLRIEELAKPTKRRLLGTLETYGSMLTAEKVDHLIQYVEGGTTLTPEQAETLVRDRMYARKLSKKKKRKKLKCPKKSKKPPKAVCESSIDLEAASCQYTIAQCFVRSILCRTCAHPQEEYRDIAEVILRRLSEVLQYEPLGTEDRKSQQMRLLASVFACWIIEILVELADKNREALEAECLKREKEASERALMEAELQAAMDADEDGRDGDDDDDAADDDDDTDVDEDIDADDGASSGATSRTGEEGSFETLPDGDARAETSTQCDADDIACQATEQSDQSQQCEVDGEDCTESVEPCTDDEQQTECSVNLDAGCATEEDDDYCHARKLASRVSTSLDSDLPFVTFAKIFDTLYCMIERESENALCDPLDNRIHRAIYEKFEQAVMLDSPALLTPKIKDVIDVNAGKIALWIRRTLQREQIDFANEHPAEVESKELRCWSKWVLEVADRGIDQSNWLDKTIGELKDIRCSGRTTRGDWQRYTSKFNTNAMLFRRAYTEAQHEKHHNTMMMTDRKIVKTGCKRRLPRFAESEECHASDVHEL
ncbi:uncharacterized protein LOC131674528 [Phymastichus coffea]|uniref:uncharacterized protein LOC131674528 n=1 Tax=Phymastichus coffea TaxID=108790 RepID=UPI00273C06B5|nr:uncharacterized protein LOC131674528 [Phymastichus coffea]